jgi:hypothetical protein
MVDVPKNIMRLFLFTYLLTQLSFDLSAQNIDTWVSFWNKDTTVKGFKDKNGIVKIEPRFIGITIANKFDNVIVVTEEIDEKWNSYHLTKAGRIFGKDSLHMFDNGPDCESEGFIRFRDRKTDKAGLFNRNGDIAVPAECNDLTRVTNGMIIALKGAERKQLGEHFTWIGGKQILIDTNNNILIDNFKQDNYLNLFSALVTTQPSADSIRQNFKGVNGLYYSFIDFDKEFRSWLQSSLLNNFTQKNLLQNTFSEIIFWKEPRGWISEKKETFLNQNFNLIKTKLLELKSDECNYDIFSEGLNSYIYEADKYQQYFNNCGESMEWLYPIKKIVISDKHKKNLQQDHFEFMRTDSGYKLISISITSGAIK